jgi:hypothetical protein
MPLRRGSSRSNRVLLALQADQQPADHHVPDCPPQGRPGPGGAQLGDSSLASNRCWISLHRPLHLARRLSAHLPRTLPPQVNTKTLTLNYACSGLSLGTNLTRPKGRRMLHDHAHHHHHHRLHGHSASHDRRLKGLFDNPIIFPPFNPALFIRKSATGVPILHSRSTSTKRIYLDFDGGC